METSDFVQFDGLWRRKFLYCRKNQHRHKIQLNTVTPEKSSKLARFSEGIGLAAKSAAHPWRLRTVCAVRRHCWLDGMYIYSSVSKIVNACDQQSSFEKRCTKGTRINIATMILKNQTVTAKKQRPSDKIEQF